jgi:hypothetical protein
MTLSALASTFGGGWESDLLGGPQVELDNRKALHYNAMQRDAAVWNVN